MLEIGLVLTGILIQKYWEVGWHIYLIILHVCGLQSLSSNNSLLWKESHWEQSKNTKKYWLTSSTTLWIKVGTVGSTLGVPLTGCVSLSKLLTFLFFITASVSEIITTSSSVLRTKWINIHSTNLRMVPEIH